MNVPAYLTVLRKKTFPMPSVSPSSTPPAVHLSSPTEPVATSAHTHQETPSTRTVQAIRDEINTLGKELTNAFTQRGVKDQDNPRPPTLDELPHASLTIRQMHEHTTATVSFITQDAEEPNGRPSHWELTGTAAAIGAISAQDVRFKKLQEELRIAELYPNGAQQGCSPLDEALAKRELKTARENWRRGKGVFRTRSSGGRW